MLSPENIYVSIISARRPQAVKLIQERLPIPATWYVAEGESDSYKQQSKTPIAVKETGPLTRSRNQALIDAFAQNAWCLQLSDDIIKCHRAINKKEKVEISIWQAVLELKAEMERTRAKLGGVAPTANEFYFNPLKPIKTSAFIVGDFLLIAPSKPRFDESLRLKEDYQLTLDHLKMYGRVCRADRLLVGFKHRDNAGGAVAYRTPELEQETIRYLKSRYPGMVKDNPRRKNEILLNIR